MKRLIFLAMFSMAHFSVADMRLKDLVRVPGDQENALVGYGLVVGLSGTGDSPSNTINKQSIRNILKDFGVNVEQARITSRNTAAVMVTADLPAYSQIGDRFDVRVESIGDARSIVGGTLLITDLKGANGDIYALSQGQVIVGGYKFEYNGDSIQKNYPTAGVIEDGAKAVNTLNQSILNADGTLSLFLRKSDFTTANNIAKAINKDLNSVSAKAITPKHVKVFQVDGNPVEFVSKLEAIKVKTDVDALVVVDESNGIIVSGNEVGILPISISIGSIEVEVESEINVSQPTNLINPSANIETVAFQNSILKVNERDKGFRADGKLTVGALSSKLRDINVSVRELIQILQAIDEAGALEGRIKVI